ncbi:MULTISPECIES: recombinase family protein [unclassified Mesorhizobium]|uniref:recombinase family protein n=1 Tax=unclassified Mesorhizobium TaxID=325217 RepID=UPI000FCA6A12|nr:MULTISPECIES: recombinase family protein [unclassified Mesorhizobium]TGU56914.1 recombinase family protein [Mesorhizobium sp. M2D.F.Ca.ET.148.01.1.1]TGU61295.1 recombinase family protein [Mesorhizobium sp. M2D.F.Ca.ET.147.01.1.1]
MQFGYARTSTDDQIAGLEAQVAALEAAGCKRIYQEHASAVGHREQFDRLMERLEDGDTLVVTKMDRLARSLVKLLPIVADLEARGVALMILDFNKGESVNTRTPTGKLMLTMMAAFAEFERDVMLERQEIGIAKARAEGKYTGRKPTAMAKADQIVKLDGEGLTRPAIAARLGVSERSVYRALEAARAA